MAKQVDVPIPHKTAYQLISSQLIDGLNKDNIAEFLMNTLSTEEKSMLIMLSQLQYMYTPLIGGDYVKFHQDATWIESKIDMDVMLDMGLMENGYLFGQICKVDEYGNAYKPFQTRSHIKLFSHDKDKNLTEDRIRIDTSNLELITQMDIPYFRMQARLEIADESI